MEIVSPMSAAAPTANVIPGDRCQKAKYATMVVRVIANPDNHARPVSLCIGLPLGDIRDPCYDWLTGM